MCEVICLQGEDIVEARLLSDDDDDEKADPLSFIPDPDEIYGRHSDNSSSDEEEEDMGYACFAIAKERVSDDLCKESSEYKLSVHIIMDLAQVFL